MEPTIDIGDYVRFDVAGTSIYGHVIEIATTPGGSQRALKLSDAWIPDPIKPTVVNHLPTRWK